MADEVLLSIRGLKVQFATGGGLVTAVDGVDLDIRKGETLGIVGESGSGKTVTALAVMRLLAKPQGRIAAGTIKFGNLDLATVADSHMHEIRGDAISMIFQEPMTSLNPVYTIGAQIVEAIQVHRKISKQEAMALALESLKKVGIPDPERRLKSYPHEMSGGMRQRAMIAMAISCAPKLLIADEPTTALDVTIQAQILQLLRELRESMSMSLLLITHDLGVVAEVTDRVAVMYGGRIAEFTDTFELFAHPLHPYTQGLMASIPNIDKDTTTLYAIPGTVPTVFGDIVGCRFANRCARATPRCTEETPLPEELRPGHLVACWNVDLSVDEGMGRAE
jgi:peptide/nickel transport system ATP-binding protein/oligopeptide transport system ATP-binding protein